MAATTFGVVSDVYRQRVMSEYDQLDYDSGANVIYPDLMRLRWMWHQPTGSNAWSGQGSTTAGASPRLQFLIPANCMTDPHSYRVYFQCTVSGTTLINLTNVPLVQLYPCAGLANYAHSVFNQLQVRFTGGSATEPEQVLNYNVFCSMLYQFFSTQHVKKIHGNLEGWTPITLTGPIAASTPSGTVAALSGIAAGGYYSFGHRRVWQGRSFMLPLNLGLFMSVRKMIPNFILPTMLIEFLMETVQNATSSVAIAPGTETTTTITTIFYGPYTLDKNLAGTGAGSTALSYVVQSPQLVVQELEVTDEYVDTLRAEVRTKQAAGHPIRLDLSSWTSYQIQIPQNTGSTFTQLVTSDICGLRKIMFGLVSSTENSSTAVPVSGVATVAKDSLNSFFLNGLRSYRFNVGAHYYPDQDIWIDNGNAQGQPLPGQIAAQDSALSYYMNAYATGTLANPSADMMQTWTTNPDDFDLLYSNDTLGTAVPNSGDPDSYGLDLPNYVYLTRTEFDDVSLPSLHYLQKSGQMLIRLTFNAAVPANTSLNCYIFLNQSRCILIEEGNRAQVING